MEIDMGEDLNLNMLGNQNIKYEFQYNPGLLETFENKHRENDYFVKFNCPEFTSLCPITSQPDFATVYISYVPEVKMIESKSLKLYLLSFRNHGDFHEDCMNIIMKDLNSLFAMPLPPINVPATTKRGLASRTKLHICRRVQTKIGRAHV